MPFANLATIYFLPLLTSPTYLLIAHIGLADGRGHSEAGNRMEACAIKCHQRQEASLQLMERGFQDLFLTGSGKSIQVDSNCLRRQEPALLTPDSGAR